MVTPHQPDIALPLHVHRNIKKMDGLKFKAEYGCGRKILHKGLVKFIFVITLNICKKYIGNDVLKKNILN